MLFNLFLSLDELQKKSVQENSRFISSIRSWISSDVMSLVEGWRVCCSFHSEWCVCKAAMQKFKVLWRKASISSLWWIFLQSKLRTKLFLTHRKGPNVQNMYKCICSINYISSKNTIWTISVSPVSLSPKFALKSVKKFYKSCVFMQIHAPQRPLGKKKQPFKLQAWKCF